MDDSPEATPYRRFGPFSLAIASGLLLWLAYPPADLGALGWVALAPMFSLLTAKGGLGKLTLASWVGGLVFGELALSWVASVDVVGMLLMGLFMSLWWPIWPSLIVRLGEAPSSSSCGCAAKIARERQRRERELRVPTTTRRG